MEKEKHGLLTEAIVLTGAILSEPVAAIIVAVDSINKKVSGTCGIENPSLAPQMRRKNLQKKADRNHRSHIFG